MRALVTETVSPTRVAVAELFHTWLSDTDPGDRGSVGREVRDRSGAVHVEIVEVGRGRRTIEEEVEVVAFGTGSGVLETDALDTDGQFVARARHTVGVVDLVAIIQLGWRTTGGAVGVVRHPEPPRVVIVIARSSR